MALEVEEAFPSFSTERIRSKVQLRDGPATQRRLDYNAPLLSVRRLIDVGGHVRSKVWKLSGELSKEPLGEAGGVPFTWEHIPGQPKQPESPPREPSSPSPPSTPSPPSSRRASPASPSVPPPPPPLRPVFLRSNSSTLFAPPPPPPPPPPPLPLIHPLPLSVRRIVPHAKRPPSSSASPAPPPPPPPPPLPPPSTFSQASKQASKTLVSQRLPDHERMGAFRLVDPTDGFLRVLRARREKAEPQEFLIHDAAEEAAEVSHKAAGEGSITAVASGRDKSSCVAVDAIVQRFLAEHPDAATEEEASVERQDDQALQEDDQARVDTVNSVDLPCGNSKHDTEKGKEVIDDASNHCGIIVSKEDAAYIPELQVPCSDVASEETQRCESKVSDGFTTEYVPLPTQENGGSMCAPISPSMDHREVQLEAGHKQSVIRKQQNTRCTSNIAILDSCRVESLQMIRSTLLQFCRKAATASIRTFARAKRKVYASGCTSSSLDVVVVPSNANRTVNEGCSDRGEDTVAREEETIVQEQFPQETHRQEALVSIPNGLPIILPRSSTDVLQERLESNPCDEINTDTKRGCTPISSPKSSTESSPLRENNEAEKKDIMSPSTHHTWSAKRGHLPVSSPKSPSENSPCLETSEAEKKEEISSPPRRSPDAQDSPALHPSEQEERLELRPRVSSIRHVYAKSFGGDEPNEFYDASSRFGSRGSTPTRLFSNRSMSKDWSIPDDFLDATSSPFETPRTSVSDIRYTFSNAELAGYSPSTASRMGSTTRQTSKLSKRVGKALWVDTRETNATGKSSWVDRGEINAAGKVDAKSCDKLKGFMSGELYPTSKESEQVLNKKEMNGTRRKYVSGDQASTSTADARREYKRDIALRRSTGKSIAVTPVFPSKCQKNRSIASASGLPQQISTVDISEMGWPLGISGFPPLKINTKVKERKERGATKGEGNMVVPLPPLPASPAGGSWLMKALSTSIQKQTPPGLASMNADAKKGESSPRPGNKWEDIVKGSHIQPGHLRFSEELHHHPPSNSTSTKYYAS